MTTKEKGLTTGDMHEFFASNTQHNPDRVMKTSTGAYIDRIECDEHGAVTLILSEDNLTTKDTKVELPSIPHWGEVTNHESKGVTLNDISNLCNAKTIFITNVPMLTHNNERIVGIKAVDGIIVLEYEPIAAKHYDEVIDAQAAVVMFSAHIEAMNDEIQRHLRNRDYDKVRLIAYQCEKYVALRESIEDEQFGITKL